MSDVSLKLSAIRKSQPVVLEVDPNDSDKVMQIYIKEMSGAQRDEYFNKASKKVKTDDKGAAVALNDYNGLFSHLLSFCTYDAEHKLLTEAKIQEWPDTLQRALHEVAMKLNGLGPEDEGSEKN